MRKLLWAVLVLVSLGTAPAFAQSAARDTTREQLRSVLTTAGARSDVNAAFRQSTKNPYNFVTSMTGLTYADSLEVVVSVTQSNTIGFRVYPHYHGGYINVDKAANPAGLMHKLLYFSDQNFLFWGADDGGDVFSGYTITLESGFPADAIVIVLRSIRNTDKFVGELRTFLT
ncbi:MAG TPA: hypothetical protein VGN14_12005 [Candidatus Elarobacter sp.]|jgi:hypothetical protein